VSNLIDEKEKIVSFGLGPLVTILMGTKNGERFLAEQLDSLANQSHQNWFLIASDDGSTDSTVTILKSYQAKWPAGKLIIKEGPKQGFCVNFLSMACDPSIRADYYAFCDQDDVWLSTKLEVGIGAFTKHSSKIAQMYCGRTFYIDENGSLIGESQRFVHPKIFRNALVQCVAGGNTMIFNTKTKVLLEKAAITDLPSHDWWLYILLTGHGGKVHFDLLPLVKYRQHPNSLVGHNQSLVAKLDRLGMVVNGSFKKFIDKNIRGIEATVSLLAQENLEVFNLFKKHRNNSLKDRFRMMQVCGLYRQSRRGTLFLIIAAILKKL
jgi:glycosyltransferase involved in cell wall biosynthesis